MAMSQRVALWEDQVQDASVKPAGEVYLLKKAPKPTWRDLLSSRDKDLIRSRAFSSNKYLGFSKNLHKGFFDARTVTYLTLQIAYHLGFSKVFLVGVDLNQNAGRFYESKGSTLSPCGLDQHFDSRILPSFRLMAEQVVGSEFAVYNLSTASRLPQSVIPFISLAQVEAMVGSSQVRSKVPTAE
ncbi:lipopolysaccharide core biosynthesis protein [compost metagenome]